MKTSLIALLVSLYPGSLLFGGQAPRERTWTDIPWVILKVQSVTGAPTSAKTVTLKLASGIRITVAVTDLDFTLQNKFLDMLGQQTTPSPAAAKEDVQVIPTPDAAMPDIKNRCAKEWPTDFQMQKYCQDQQRQAVSKLGERYMLGTSEHRTIRLACAKEWSEDFAMQDYCEIQQLKALSAIR